MLSLEKQQPTHSGFKRWFVLLLLFGLGAGVFLTAYMSIHGGGLLGPSDMNVWKWMSAHRDASITPILMGITNAASPTYIAGAVLIGTGIWAFLQKELWRPGLLLGAMGAVFVTGTVLKHIVHRTRPPMSGMIHPFETDFSFPSGHTFGVAVCVLVLGYLIYSRTPRILSFLIWMLASLVSVALIVESRLYLGYHWLTDVLGSIGLSLIILGVVIVIDLIASSRFTLKKPTEVL